MNPPNNNQQHKPMNELTPKLDEGDGWLAAVLREIDRARAKFPTWPTDPLHAVAVLQEEVGELQKAVLERCYKFDSVSLVEVSSEAVQVAVMALRFLDSMMEYNWRPAEQHLQRVACAACDRGDFQLGHADGCQQGGDA